MSGTLTKKLIQSVITYSGTPGSPGDPGSPAVAGHYGYATGTTNIAGGPVFGAPYKYNPVTKKYDIPTLIGYIKPTSVPSTNLVWFPPQPARAPTPAVAATSARTLTSSNVGWTGGGRSVDIMTGGGTFYFTVPVSVAVIVGLVEADQSTSPNEALHGFYIYRRELRIRESGVDVFYSPGTPHSAANLYGINRSGNTISYLVNGQVIHTSASRSALPVMLDTSLYVAGDTVVLQALSAGTRGVVDGEFEPIVGLLGDDYAQIDGRFGAFGGDLLSEPRLTVDGYLHPLIGLLGRASYAQVDAGFLAIQGELTAASITPVVNILDGEFSPMVASAVHSVRVSLVVDGEFPPLLGRAGRYTDIDGSLGALTADLSEGDGNVMTLFSGVMLSCGVDLATILSISFSSGFAVLGELATNEVLTVEMQGALAAGMSTTMQTLHSLNIQSGIGFASSNSSDAYVAGQRSATAWVTNLDTGAVSMYAGFDFDRMYELDGKYYGVRDTSTYLLDGNTDNGAPIDAFVAFGKQNFGTSALKHVPNFYAGVSSTGVLLLRVSTGAETYTYTPRRTDPYSKVQRYDLGKGLRANYYEFELFSQAGCDFELDTVEFLALPTGRRI